MVFTIILLKFHYIVSKIEQTLAIIAFPAYKTEFTDLMCITISNYPVDVYYGHVSLNLDYFMDKERVFSMGLVRVVFNFSWYNSCEHIF